MTAPAEKPLKIAAWKTFRDPTVLFGTAAVLLLFLISTWTWRAQRSNQLQVIETLRELRQVDDVLSTVKDAETGQRGYLLTGSSVYLDPYNHAVSIIHDQMTALGKTVRSQFEIRSDYDLLRKAVDSKLAELGETVDLARGGDMDAALARVRTNAGRAEMERVRDISARMDSLVRHRLDRDTRYGDASSLRLHAVSVAASLLLFALVAVANVRYRRQKLEAEAASRAKSAFLASMSHELRTPLNAIIGYSEMLSEEAAETNAVEILPDLEKIRMAGKHLLDLINSVLDLSKIEAGKMELFLETFGIESLVKEVIDLSAPLAAKNGNSLDAKVPPEIGEMRADRTKIQQCVYNLMSNACKFTSNGRIELSVSRGPDGFVNFEVGDTGIGMTAEQLAKLFQSFTQGDASMSRRFGGTGLGLSLSRNFARMMGGDILARSEHGRGSVFTLRIPSMVSAPTSGEIRAVESKSGRIVLVIDDDADVHELLRRTLSRQGFHVESARSGDEGLRLARSMQPRAITLDVMMPGMDGWTVLARLKNDPATADIPVVMLTIIDNKNLGFAMGAAEYLTKPIDRARLSAVLSRYRGTGDNSALVVEDEAESREVTRRMLEAEGWRVREARNGAEALEQLRHAKPSVVVLDLMMPEVDGFQVLDAIHANDEWKDLPVLVVTAKELTPEERGHLNGHVDSVLQKGSYRKEEFLDRVADLVADRAGRGATVSKVNSRSSGNSQSRP